ncbi:MAG: hypothetical protein GY894_11055 [Planctomycetes bacterium]|nr:hypothetical protein [Planctomycetota bacterium]MCP4839875.1 hypothetical protein [Planctomycetota bacterium]
MIGATAVVRRADEIQRLRWVRILLTILIVAASAGFFGTVIGIRQGWDTNAKAIVIAFAGDDKQTFGTLLRESGAVVIGDREYAAPIEVLETLIDESGSVQNAQGLVMLLLRDDIPSWAPRWLLLETELAWMLMGLVMVLGVAIVWGGLAVRVGTLLASGLALSLVFGAIGWDRWVGVPISMAMLLSTFLLIIRMLQLALGGRQGWAAVAHTVLAESSRTRLALGFVITLLIALPLLPLTLDKEAPIDQFVQAYLIRSLDLSYALAAVMVLVIACSTVSFDIRDRHIWHIATKPLGRLQYLLGKWIGVVLLGASVLVLAGAWSYGYVRYLESSAAPKTVSEFEEFTALQQDVLVARSTRLPTYEELEEGDVRGRIDEILLEDPEFQDYVDGDVPLRVYRTLRNRVVDQFDQQRRRLPSVLDRSNPPWVVIHFEGLKHAKQLGSTVRLGFRLLGGLSDEHERRLIGFAVGEDRTEGIVGAFVPTVPQDLEIPNSAIADDGTLDISMVNLTHVPAGRGNDWVGPVNLEGMALQGGGLDPFELVWMVDGMEITYPDGTFGSNFVLALTLVLLKLSILAALGCGLATALSFPVACLAVFTVYVGASMAPWLATAIPYYGGGPPGSGGVGELIQDTVQWLIRTVASSMVYVLRAFGELQPVERLIQGRLIEWGQVWAGLVMLLTWGGGALAVGWLILSRRQLAIYSGE